MAIQIIKIDNKDLRNGDSAGFINTNLPKVAYPCLVREILKRLIKSQMLEISARNTNSRCTCSQLIEEVFHQQMRSSHLRKRIEKSRLYGLSNQ